MPQGGMEALVNKNPLEILAYQYDVVCNGYEVASGAVRNHDPEIMLKAFKIAGYKEDDVKNKEEYEDEETIEKEDTDEEGNPRQYKTGPNGGRYYRVKKDGKWGPWNSCTNENKIFKSLKMIISESNLCSLKSYLKK